MSKVKNCRNCGSKCDFDCLYCSNYDNWTLRREPKQELDTESDTSKITLEQAREKFEVFLYQSCIPTIRTEFPKDIRGNYKFSTDQMKWEAYQQALKDHNILQEGE